MRILFVDDQSHILQGLRRRLGGLLRRMRIDWGMSFVNSPRKALELLAQEPFDVVISDMHMPVVDGAELLALVRDLHPGIVRIILSGSGDKEAILKTVCPAHRFLSKPCDAQALVDTVLEAIQLRDLLANEALKGLVSRMSSLPSLPSLYLDIMDELQSEEPSLQKIAETVHRDISMTAKVLQVVNSGFFGLAQRMTDASRAVSYLGTDTVRALVLSTGVIQQLQENELLVSDIEGLWAHCMKTGLIAKGIASTENASSEIVDAAFQAGFMHDIGKLVIAANLPSEYAEIAARVEARGVAWSDAEREKLGSTHAEVGGYLLGLWGMPDLVVEAVRFHHEPSLLSRSGFSPGAAVHVANALERECTDADNAAISDPIDRPFLEEAGLARRLEVWRESCLGVLQQ